MGVHTRATVLPIALAGKNFRQKSWTDIPSLHGSRESRGYAGTHPGLFHPHELAWPVVRCIAQNHPPLATSGVMSNAAESGLRRCSTARRVRETTFRHLRAGF